MGLPASSAAATISAPAAGRRGVGRVRRAAGTGQMHAKPFWHCWHPTLHPAPPESSGMMLWPTMFWGAMSTKASASSTSAAPRLPVRMRSAAVAGWQVKEVRTGQGDECTSQALQAHMPSSWLLPVCTQNKHPTTPPLADDTPFSLFLHPHTCALPPVHLLHDAQHAIQAQRHALRAPQAGRKVSNAALFRCRLPAPQPPAPNPAAKPTGQAGPSHPASQPKACPQRPGCARSSPGTRPVRAPAARTP